MFICSIIQSQVDRELAASIAPEREMAQDEAVKLAKAAFDELARLKLVDARHYNWDKPDVASTWVGGGQLGGTSTERKRIEYRITVRRTINGMSKRPPPGSPRLRYFSRPRVLPFRSRDGCFATTSCEGLSSKSV